MKRRVWDSYPTHGPSFTLIRDNSPGGYMPGQGEWTLEVDDRKAGIATLCNIPKADLIRLRDQLNKEFP